MCVCILRRACNNADNHNYDELHLDGHYISVYKCSKYGGALVSQVSLIIDHSTHTLILILRPDPAAVKCLPPSPHPASTATLVCDCDDNNHAIALIFVLPPFLDGCHGERSSQESPPAPASAQCGTLLGSLFLSCRPTRLTETARQRSHHVCLVEDSVSSEQAACGLFYCSWCTSRLRAAETTTGTYVGRSSLRRYIPGTYIHTYPPV